MQPKAGCNSSKQLLYSYHIPQMHMVLIQKIFLLYFSRQIDDDFDALLDKFWPCNFLMITEQIVSKGTRYYLLQLSTNMVIQPERFTCVRSKNQMHIHIYYCTFKLRALLVFDSFSTVTVNAQGCANSWSTKHLIDFVNFLIRICSNLIVQNQAAILQKSGKNHGSLQKLFFCLMS